MIGKARANRDLLSSVDPLEAAWPFVRWGSAVLSIDAVEEVCESRQTTLVIHPAIRRAIKGYEESFYVGLRCFLAGESDGLYFPSPPGGRLRAPHLLEAGFARRAQSPQDQPVD